MPIYEFECGSCGHHFDHLQKLSDPDPTVCPTCGELQLRRMVSAPFFRLAGNGWYETDFKKDGEKKQHLAGTAGDHHASHGSVSTASTAAASPSPAPSPAPAPAATSGASAAAK
ncbi:MAG TPA: zinc ribbon domain-containing protein [Rhodanobacter sp.]